MTLALCMLHHNQVLQLYVLLMNSNRYFHLLQIGNMNMIAVLFLSCGAFMLCIFFILVVAKSSSLRVVQQLVVLLTIVALCKVDVQKVVLHFANGRFDVEGDTLHVLVGFAHGVDG